MRQFVEPAPAKINLALHVRRRRPDGYHDIETLFAFARDGDALRFDYDRSGFSMTGPFAAALSGGPNLVEAAVTGFAAEWPNAPLPALELVKRLPVASGIGGGSADAAAALRGLARHAGVATDDPRLFALAVRLGADVPACLFSRTARGGGKGEELRTLPDFGDVPMLLVNPGVAVSTAAVFGAWDGKDRGPMLEAVDDVLENGRNDLEAPARAVAPVIGSVLSDLRARQGVTLARMSGSGATCFALFETLSDRDRAAAAIAATHPDWWCLKTALV